MSGPGEIRSKLAELAERFLQRTGADLATMRGLAEGARGGEDQPLVELRNLAHRMHGTGATLGFAEIGEQAAQIEALSEERPCDLEAVDACIARIEALVRDGAPGRS